MVFLGPTFKNGWPRKTEMENPVKISISNGYAFKIIN